MLNAINGNEADQFDIQVKQQRHILYGHGAFQDQIPALLISIC